jgi:hypothetical protein
MRDRDPNDTIKWKNDPVPEYMDPVLSNVYNGGWLCNFESRERHNNKLCHRAFNDRHIIAPYNYGMVIDMDSKLRTLDQPLNNYCIKK